MARSNNDLTTAQRAVVLQVLRDDHPNLWSRTELAAELVDLDPQTLLDALATLFVNGVAAHDGQQICASSCLRHLDRLGMVTV